MEKAKDDKLAENVSVVSKTGDTTATVKSSEGASYLKLKMNPPNFSGKCRDFSVFKRDFLSIVGVGHRSNIEKEVLLK